MHLEPTETPIAEILQMNDHDLREMLQQIPLDYAYSVTSMLRLGDERKAYLASEYTFQGHCKEDAYLTFYDLRTCAKDFLDLPMDKTYRIELIDTWEMTRKVLFERASGKTELYLPAKEGMAVLATRLTD